jgi:hypothetical protein
MSESFQFADDAVSKAVFEIADDSEPLTQDALEQCLRDLAFQ